MFCKSCGNEIKVGTKFCVKCGQEIITPPTVTIKSKKLFSKRTLGIIAIFALATLVAVTFYYNMKDTSRSTDQNIASSVVNIYCTGETEEDTYGGSGTIMSEDGWVLTNAHIIPTAETESDGTDSCLVILPDPITGSPDEMYTAYPVVVVDLSEKYDLAFIKINDVYYDPEEGKAYGEYPKIFPAYDSNRYCKNENVKLGEPVRIYGYPSISGGSALTVTDGIVSSLIIDEGYIITSAKISHGNSGGLAVDQYGCRIGIPSMVSGDEYESLGVIISNDLITEFLQEVKTTTDSQ